MGPLASGTLHLIALLHTDEVALGQLFKSPTHFSFSHCVFRRMVATSCIILGFWETPYVQHLARYLAFSSCFLKWQMLVILALISSQSKCKWLCPLQKSLTAVGTNQGTKTPHHDGGCSCPLHLYQGSRSGPSCNTSRPA